MFQKYIQDAELPDHYSLHSLRHTYVTYLRSKGIPQDIVSILVGHLNPTTTANYDHTAALSFRQYADLIDFESRDER